MTYPIVKNGEVLVLKYRVEGERVTDMRVTKKKAKKAKWVKELTGPNWHGIVHLFKVSPPVPYDYDWDNERNRKKTSFVVVSAAVIPLSGPETYIFASDRSGSVQDWGELDGSYKGGLSILKALKGAGYIVEGFPE